MLGWCPFKTTNYTVYLVFFPEASRLKGLNFLLKQKHTLFLCSPTSICVDINFNLLYNLSANFYQDCKPDLVVTYDWVYF